MNARRPAGRQGSAGSASEVPAPTGSRRARWTGGFGVVVALVMAAALVVPAQFAPSVIPAAAPPPTTVTADQLPTWQVNGVVWKMATSGNTVYAVGSFTKARPPGVPVGGAGEINANNAFAFDITTGERVAGFAPQLNGQALAAEVSPDGATLYIGGDFTTVDGQARNHLAAFDTATGQLTPWAPSTDGQVRALAVTGTDVYVGGNFRSASGQPRSRLAQFSRATAALSSWAPVVDNGYVWSMTLVPDRSALVVGGSFTSVGGTAQYGMGKLDAATGAVRPWPANLRIRAGGSYGAITSLRADDTQVYGAGYSFGSGATFEGTFAADPGTGAITWVNDCLGDSYDVVPFAGALYSVGHSHDCTVIGGFPDTSPRARWQEALASHLSATGMNTFRDAYLWNYTGLPNAANLPWYPDLGFGKYTNAKQAAWATIGSGQYLALGGEFPTVNGVAQQGLTRFALPGVAPKKSGPRYLASSDPVATSTESGTVRIRWAGLWDRDDERLTYDLYRDNRRITTITDVASSFWSLPDLGYLDTGLTPGASHQYQVRVTDGDGNALWSVKTPAVTVASTSPPAARYARAVAADGAAHHWRLGEPLGAPAAVDAIGYADALALSNTFGAEGLPATPADTAVGFSSPYGRLATIGSDRSPEAVTTEAWIKTTTATGGRIVGFGDASSAWSVVRDRVLYLDNTGRVNFTVSTDRQYAVRSAAAVNDGRWHHVAGSYSGGVLSVYVDGNLAGQVNAVPAPREYDGYWRLGADQTLGFVNRPTDMGMVGQVDEVAVYPSALSAETLKRHYELGLGTAPNQPPTADFTTTTNGLWVRLDGTGSNDPDGVVSGYAWDFGDGATGTGATAEHTYAAAGTYSVTLTVTDDAGASTSTTKSMAVTPGAAFVARDDFERAVTGGWGSALIGGPWSVTGAASQWSVAASRGMVGVPAGTGPTARLGVSAADIDALVRLSTDRPSTGGGQYVSVVGRSIPGVGDYRVKLRLASGGAVTAWLSRTVGTTSADLASVVVPGLTYAAGDTLAVRLQVAGTAPTGLRAKVWKDGTAEPAAWLVIAADATPGLAAAGGFAITPYVSGSTTNGPVNYNFSGLEVRPVP